MAFFAGSASSGKKTAGGHVITSSVFFTGIVVATDGTNDVTFTVYRGSSADDANAITPTAVVKGAENYGGIFPTFPVKCNGGIYVSISGGSFNYVVYYTTQGGVEHTGM